MTIIQEKKAPIIALDTNQQEEELLSWLQEFHATIIKPLGKDLPEDIPDNQIARYNPFRDTKTLKPYSLMIGNIDNPGWDLDFALDDHVLLGNSLTKVVIDDQALKNNSAEDNNDLENNWLRTFEKNNIFSSVGGPLYLNAVLYCFKAQIEGKELVTEDEIARLQNSRNTQEDKNKLLTWLEDFYFSYCDGDWEHTYGFIIISCHSGWIIECYIGGTDVECKQFDKVYEDEGKIECYKLNDKVIIRTHSRGLIESLKIFKKWVES